MNQLLRIHAIWNPHVYHGWGRSKRFFEGWYYKVVNNSETTAFAIIPGIAMDENGNKQSFIQILDGINNIAKYHKFDSNEYLEILNFSNQSGINYFDVAPFYGGGLAEKRLGELEIEELIVFQTTKPNPRYIK